MSLKQKAIGGVIWSAIDSFAGQGITFIVGLVLARLLSPAEFGLIGMLAVFMAISESFINSGFSNALIRKKDATQVDFSTVFYFNLVVGVLFYFILFFSAPYVAVFFEEPQLDLLLKILALGLIVSSLTLIQRTTLTKQINFKLQARISVIAALISGVIGVSMAYKGFGVWSLVAQSLSRSFINSVLLWLWNRWRPLWVFSIASFKELFAFGSRLLISGLIDTIYRNIYHIVIGKYFSAQELGFYTRANQFKDMPAQNLNSIMSRVTYPVLAELQDDKVKLKAGYKRMIKSIMFISMVLLAGLAAVAEPMIITLIGEQWHPSIIYLQLLTFVGMMYPLHALNLNMLQVQGRSDLFLRLEIIKKIIAIPVIIVGIFYGVKALILGSWFTTLIAYYLNSYWSGKFINYSAKEQIKDILPGFGIALSMGFVVLLVGYYLPASYLMKLIVQISIGAVLTLTLSEVFKVEAYHELKNIALEKFRQ